MSRVELYVNFMYTRSTAPVEGTAFKVELGSLPVPECAVPRMGIFPQHFGLFLLTCHGI
jgi:hypothetical protein